MQGYVDLDDLLADYGNGTIQICRPEGWLEPDYSYAVSSTRLLLPEGEGMVECK